MVRAAHGGTATIVPVQQAGCGAPNVSGAANGSGVKNLATVRHLQRIVIEWRKNF